MRADEYVVEELFRLREENEDLKKQLLSSERDNETLSKNCDFLLKRFNKLVSNIKKDFNIELKSQSLNGKSFFVWKDDENYEFYKEVFDLEKQNNEEEGEEKDE